MICLGENRSLQQHIMYTDDPRVTVLRDTNDEIFWTAICIQRD